MKKKQRLKIPMKSESHYVKRPLNTMEKQGKQWLLGISSGNRQMSSLGKGKLPNNGLSKISSSCAVSATLTRHSAIMHWWVIQNVTHNILKDPL